MTDEASSEATRYAAAWRDLSRRDWLFLGPPVAIVPAGLASAFLASHLPRALDWIAATLPLGALAIWTTAILYRSAFACPRCGKPFFMTTWRQSPLAGNCLHCQLPRGAAPE